MDKLKFAGRIIVGLVFMFSGIVKAVDPLGSAYKFNDYFIAFNLDFLKPFSLVLAILLFTAEFLAGFSVLSGYRIKTGIWGVMLLMLVFTPLTLVLALTNPVSDCGCFGDAIHLTNWQTFWKNIVLMVFTVILFAGRKRVKNVFSPLKEWSITGAVGILFVVFSLLNLRYLQLFDFLPYKTGVNIPESMIIPEGKPVDEYETTFIYEKDGVQKEFTLDNYPADDTTWVFVDQKTILVKKGYIPPIHDFIITVPSGEDIAGEVLADPEYTLLMISQKLSEADPDHLAEGFETGEYCQTAGIRFLVLTASGTDELSGYQNNLTFCTGDETTLKTIVRSNPGYMLLKEGKITGKWSWATLPPKETFSPGMSDGQLLKMNRKSPVLIGYSSALALLILILLAFPAFKKDRQ
ncbi:MAG: DoxX family protein [Bacteroidales bacterium]|jgi:uncharacterized membrane protein YphA (DoxX/SURF4 family)|nr:DoxX family protein [Bacteroidales bacterium]